jgi:hypothetical protein
VDKVYVCVVGGVVQEVLSKKPLKVILIDFDDDDSRELADAYVAAQDEEELINNPLIYLRGKEIQ